MPTAKILPVALFALLISTGLAAGELQMDRAAAAQYFQEAENLSERDGGVLWGIPLYGPMLLVHPETREIVANQGDPAGVLKQAGRIWTGILPDSENVANTAMDWGGCRWTMLLWPLPEKTDRRANLMMHELFHRVQDELGFPAANPANAHLDEMAGRLWLRLELEALRAALGSEGEEQTGHIRNALVFRARRHGLFDGAAVEEAALERNEGLAEYTGVSLCGRDVGQTRAYLCEQIDGVEALPTLVRSFAYTTGPIYGILLDSRGPGWRKQITSRIGLGDLLARQCGITLPANLAQEAEKLLPLYGGEAIRKVEAERERLRQEQLAVYRKLLVEGPVLVIRLQAMQVQFDPRTLQPLGEHGTVYPTLRIADTWGILTVTGAALLHPDWSQVTVPAGGIEPGMSGGTVETEGWTLELAEGWGIVPTERPGDFTVHHSSP
jgi:hypothetical protein